MNEKVGTFLSDRGFYEISEFGLRPVASKIEPAIIALDHSQFARVSGVNSRSTREMFWYLPNVGIYCYNYRLLDPNTGVGPWSGPWAGIFVSAGVHSMWQTLDASGARIVLAGFGDGFIRRLDAPGVKLDDVLSDGSGGLPITMSGTCAPDVLQDADAREVISPHWITATLRGTSTLAIALQCATGVKTKTFAQIVASKRGASANGARLGSGAARAARSREGRPLRARKLLRHRVYRETGPSVPVISRIEVQAFDMGERA
jgi:hypothetical protein